MHEARFYKKEGEEVRCFLCKHFCRIKNGESGRCGIRKNIDGTLYALTYGKAIALALDPIEKKPFYHFHPKARTLSFSTVGCNFSCLYCQNWEISQPKKIEGQDISPEEMVELAVKYRANGIAYTYTEPTVFMEYALDTAKLAKEKGLFNVFVTNGYESDAAISEMVKVIDAARIDLKFFDEKHYREVCGAELDGVLRTIKMLHKKMHIEIIILVVPGYNDDLDTILAESEWIRGLSPDIPVHFIGFYPSYKMMHVPPTPLETLRKARTIAMECGLKYVYTGNRLDRTTESTYCWNCGKLIVLRQGFEVVDIHLKKEKGKVVCPYCGVEQNFIM
jgi:pyruvate formate lyase activating enzyme